MTVTVPDPAPPRDSRSVVGHTRLWHVTLETGQVRASPSAEVAGSTIRHLWPLIVAGGGPLGVEGLSFKLQRHGPSDASFEVVAGDRSLVDCWLGCDRPAEIWAMVREARSALALGPVAPWPTPWLAVSIDPAALLLAGWETTSMLGDIERCIAWSILHPPGRASLRTGRRTRRAH